MESENIDFAHIVAELLKNQEVQEALDILANSNILVDLSDKRTFLLTDGQGNNNECNISLLVGLGETYYPIRLQIELSELEGTRKSVAEILSPHPNMGKQKVYLKRASNATADPSNFVDPCMCPEVFKVPIINNVLNMLNDAIFSIGEF